jgi:hypothetical protein
LQEFHDRLKAEQDILESYDTEESVAYIQVSTLAVLYLFLLLDHSL